ncbi:MAG: urease accessory protein UreD [Rhodospirillales bacterium]|nr:urease accessory protein UreD [Rhodospirillales bacterium]
MSTRSVAACRSDLQRATGVLRVAVKRRGAASVLDDLRQEGCLKARFPRPVDWFETVTLNSSGGIAGGDTLDAGFAVGQGARASFASQAAERFYRARDEDAPARVRTRIDVAADAAAEWLPQEAILFDGAALDRSLSIDMTADAWFLGIESLVFGRAAMGERVGTLHFRDTIRIRRAGRLILHDAIRLDGDAATTLASPATARGGAAVATLIHVAPDAEAALSALRTAWAGTPAETGASAWDGMLLGRVVAADGAALRRAVRAGLLVLRQGRSLPRVWNC